MSGRPRGPGDDTPSPGRRGRGPGAAGSVAQAHEAVAAIARSGRPAAAGGTGVPHGPAAEFRPGFPRGADFIDSGGGFSPEAADAYRRIRHSPEDTALVASHTGIDPAVVERMRRNLFVEQHDVAVGPNRVERGYFTPDDDIAELWDAAARGTLGPTRLADFRALVAHEYVENKLMEAGLPYRSAHPDSFNAEGDNVVNRLHPGAHDLAPHAWRPDAPLEHWQRFGLDGSALEMAPDLSNLDAVVQAVLGGLGR
ncbi:hypothetical protein Ade02nite_73410 [Paractinoplanes deccanensis]|uniref:Uncharacterized protein n=1 Tax=Paractinoplanes deccanensis TaxID=113561 RepID=A0ABQ3YFM3_9ACTN|nr:hypothetical protein [Actinoplanes deccanensis]GID78700.1 hypothetical protein Ade02nite_73410 [Actinoplanes deccanensis]